MYSYDKTKIPLIPSSWYRACMAVDTIDGVITVVVNGNKEVDQVIKEFENSFKKRPKTMEEKLLLFKMWPMGFWYQSRGRVSNINIFAAKLSPEKMIDITAGNSCGAKGDYLSWKDMKWTLFGDAREDQVKLDNICQENSNIFVLTEEFPSQQDCMLACPKFGECRVPDVGTKSLSQSVLEEVKQLITQPETSQRFPGIPSSSVWIPATDENLDGTWTDFYTTRQLVSTDFITSPGGVGGSKCAIMVIPWGGWSEWVCHSDLVLCACQCTTRPYLKLRGLCPQSNIDTFYLPRNNPEDGQLTFYGLKNTIIKYEEGAWRLRVIGAKEKTRGVAHSSKHSFLLGHHSWEVTGDSPGCTGAGGSMYNTTLKLSGCATWQFTCYDGECVDMVQRCDKVPDCKDRSDEQDCIMLVMEEMYDKTVPPFRSDIQRIIDPVLVNLSLIIKSIDNIDKDDNELTIKYLVSQEWYDSRIVFHNLKLDRKLNVLTENVVNSVWTPKIRVENAKISKSVEADDAIVTVTREGVFSRSDDSSVEEIEIFPGYENKLKKKETMNTVLDCQFNLRNYPFDNQVGRKGLLSLSDYLCLGL